MSEKQIIVAGGGMGGLGAALGLAKHGKRVVVLERAPEFGEIGAGIQLGPNVFHAFEYLGVGQGASEQAVFIDRLNFMDAITGEEVNHLSLEEGFRDRYGNPYAVVHRADLHLEFVRACEENELIELRTNSEVIGYEQDGSSITAKLTNGEAVSGELLIGADGLRSAIRAQLIGDGEPRISGHSTYRAVIPYDQMPEELRWNAATLWMGPKCHLVHYPLSGWKVFNLVITKDNNAKEAVTAEPVEKETVRTNFDHIHPFPQKLIDLADVWRRWVLCDREPTEQWVDGRAVLLGDAAHPTMQYYAQGACMAVEDAVCLSHLVGQYSDDIEKALPMYRDKRVVRTARIQLGSRSFGENWFHVDGVRAKIRNEIMRDMTAEDYYRQLDWVYGNNALSNVE